PLCSPPPRAALPLSRSSSQPRWPWRLAGCPIWRSFSLFHAFSGPLRRFQIWILCQRPLLPVSLLALCQPISTRWSLPSTRAIGNLPHRLAPRRSAPFPPLPAWAPAALRLPFELATAPRHVHQPYHHREPLSLWVYRPAPLAAGLRRRLLRLAPAALTLHGFERSQIYPWWPVLRPASQLCRFFRVPHSGQCFTTH
ncbi:hypothetical protein C8R47DRAFT_148234, partial [Mycena vitilis]